MEGTVTGEHGIGLMLRDELEEEVGENAIDMMRKVGAGLLQRIRERRTIVPRGSSAKKKNYDRSSSLSTRIASSTATRWSGWRDRTPETSTGSENRFSRRESTVGTATFSMHSFACVNF